MLFTILNTACLDSGMGGFEYQTEDEKIDEVDAQIEMFKEKGFFK